MSPTPTNRSRGHRSVGVGDSDLEAVEAHYIIIEQAPFSHAEQSLLFFLCP
ncbi:MAG: hypothetical protein K2H92_04100 [Bacteroidaceae bacterium]|nr:hypothetical protein [Bacteroidaceae bacterium]